MYNLSGASVYHEENTTYSFLSSYDFSLSLSLFFFFFVFFLGPHVRHMEVPQARNLIGAIAAGLHHSHSNTRSELCLQHTAQLTATPDP